MGKFTFTIYTDANEIYGYLFNVTRVKAQKTVETINRETGKYHYYMEDYKER